MDESAAEVADTSAIHTPRARSARSTILPAPTPAGHPTGVAVHLQTGRIQDAPSSPSPVSRAGSVRVFKKKEVKPRAPLPAQCSAPTAGKSDQGLPARSFLNRTLS
ncbi:hypothetical protein BGX38DRAFT_121538 [Terfezia claveryi]|nr:hypothetical protein BGX38DRAFT_121538 [Terfezia claveryi]